MTPLFWVTPFFKGHGDSSLVDVGTGAKNEKWLFSGFGFQPLNHNKQRCRMFPNNNHDSPNVDGQTNKRKKSHKQAKPSEQARMHARRKQTNKQASKQTNKQTKILASKQASEQVSKPANKQSANKRIHERTSKTSHGHAKRCGACNCMNLPPGQLACLERRTPMKTWKQATTPNKDAPSLVYSSQMEV